MDIHTTPEGNIMLVSLTGRLDGMTSSRLESAFLDLMKEKHLRYVFDFAALEYVSSAGLRVILGAAKKLKAVQGKLVLAGLNEHVKEVFEMAGLDAIFVIVPSRHEALEVLSS